MQLSDFGLQEGVAPLSGEEQHQRILAGLEDAEAGRMVAHGQVRAWALSLKNAHEARALNHLPPVQ